MARAKTKPQQPKATKEELERKKIELEIKDLEQPFWKRPSYVLAALPTILAVVTLLVGLFSGYFSASLTKLENQQHDLKVEKDDLLGERAALIGEVKDFEIKRDELHLENERLKAENEKLKAAEKILLDQMVEERAELSKLMLKGPLPKHKRK